MSNQRPFNNFSLPYQLVPQIEVSKADHGMCAGRNFGTIVLFESAMHDKCFPVRFNQDQCYAVVSGSWRLRRKLSK